MTLTIEQRDEKHGHGQERPTTKAAQVEGNRRRRVTARARRYRGWCSLSVPFGSGSALERPGEKTLGQPSAAALTPQALRTRGPGRVLVLSASGVRTLMRDVPSIQDKVLAALTARLSDD